MNKDQFKTSLFTGQFVKGNSRFYAQIFVLLMISFLFNSCSSNGKNKVKELNVIERIGEDISLYRFHIEHGKKTMEQVISSAEFLLEAIRNPGVQISDEEIEANVHKLTYLWLSGTPTTEYVALINTGEIKLISSEELR